MSRLTGNEVIDLMEAYQSIYAPQELTEEQIWEEVEYWVNSLVEEGYDLSDYTWEDMYEVYLNNLNEAPQSSIFNWNNPETRRAFAAASAQASRDAMNRTFAAGGGANSLLHGGGFLGTYSRGLQRQGLAPAPSAPAGSRPAPALGGSRRAPALGGSRPATTRGAVAAAPSTSPTASGSVAPQTARVASTTPTPPVAPASPRLGPTGMPLVGGIERRIPTRAEMDAARSAREAAVGSNQGGRSLPVPVARQRPLSTPSSTSSSPTVPGREANIAANIARSQRPTPAPKPQSPMSTGSTAPTPSTSSTRGVSDAVSRTPRSSRSSFTPSPKS